MASPEAKVLLENENRKQLNESDTMEIDLVELMYRLLEKAKYIILAALLGAILAGGYTFWLVTPKYTATSKLYVVNGTNSVIDLSALNMGTQLASDYKEVFSNWHVHERVLEKLDLPYSYNQLNKMVSVTNSDSQRILHINVVSTTPEEAKLLADTYAQVAQEFIAETMSTQRPNIFEEALRPTAPSSPNKTRNIILGFMLGAIVAAGIVVVQFIVDDRIHSEEDITKYLNLPVLGMMPSQRQGAKSKKGKAQPHKSTEKAKGAEGAENTKSAKREEAEK
ncbi:MAG: polysaccharide export protein [Clostridia bacterium]|nr:polysaccharide export protein [Clostridia bacterium]